MKWTIRDLVESGHDRRWSTEDALQKEEKALDDVFGERCFCRHWNHMVVVVACLTMVIIMQLATMVVLAVTL